MSPQGPRRADRGDPRGGAEAVALHRRRGERDPQARRDRARRAGVSRRVRDRDLEPGPADPLHARQRAHRGGGRARLLPVAGHGRRAAARGAAAVHARDVAARRGVRPRRASRCRPSSRTRTCWSCSTSPASRCAAPIAATATRSSWPAARAPRTPSRSRRSSTCSSWARPRRGCCGSSRSSRRRPTARSGWRASRRSPYLYVPAHGTQRVERAGVRRASTSTTQPTRAGRAVRQRHLQPRLGRGHARLHPRLPLLPRRHVVPAGARAAGRGRRAGRARAARLHGLRRALADVARDERLHAASRRRSARSSRSGRRCTCHCHPTGSTRDRWR